MLVKYFDLNKKPKQGIKCASANDGQSLDFLGMGVKMSLNK